MSVATEEKNTDESGAFVCEEERGEEEEVSEEVEQPVMADVIQCIAWVYEPTMGAISQRIGVFTDMDRMNEWLGDLDPEQFNYFMTTINYPEIGGIPARH